MLASFVWAAVLPSARADVASIVEGDAVLTRNTTRHALAEGVVLRNEDIVETGSNALALLELTDGVLVGLGESTRVLLQPRIARSKVPGPRLYLLEGWLKLSQPAEQTATFAWQSPRLDIAAQAATLVTFIARSGEYSVFVESGTARLTERDGARATLALKAGEFVSRAAADTKPIAVARVTPEFLSKMPRFFRDPLPARGALLADRKVVPRALAEISYADVTPWLRTEPPLRLPLSTLWRSRASDPEFRAQAKANLARHMEWEPVVDPEGYAKRKAEEEERRRAREAARAAGTLPGPRPGARAN